MVTIAITSTKRLQGFRKHLCLRRTEFGARDRPETTYIYQIPEDEVDAAIKAGGQRVDEGTVQVDPAIMASLLRRTQSVNSMRVSLGGLVGAFTRHYRTDAGHRYQLNEFREHYYQARDAWLAADLKTVAEFFGLYT